MGPPVYETSILSWKFDQLTILFFVGKTNADVKIGLLSLLGSRAEKDGTGGLWLTDIVHHHLAIPILFLIAGHMYRTNWGIGHGLKDIFEAQRTHLQDKAIRVFIFSFETWSIFTENNLMCGKDCYLKDWRHCLCLHVLQISWNAWAGAGFLFNKARPDDTKFIQLKYMIQSVLHSM